MKLQKDIEKAKNEYVKKGGNTVNGLFIESFKSLSLLNQPHKHV